MTPTQWWGLDGLAKAGLGLVGQGKPWNGSPGNGLAGQGEVPMLRLQFRERGRVISAAFV